MTTAQGFDALLRAGIEQRRVGVSSCNLEVSGLSLDKRKAVTCRMEED
jgi:hypothetical protein